jgi:hypothetical protein
VDFFRLGLNIEPGFKFIGGLGFLGNTGVMLKFNDKLSIIPHFGMYPYVDEREYQVWIGWDPFTGDDIYETRKEEDGAITFNVGATVRYEFPRKIITTSTKYEYDVDKQEFRHYYYHGPFRPYAQVHLGTFLGAGGGILYYLHSTFAIGAGADLGVNVLAEDNIFGVVAPKAVIITSF